jgi:small subunit ribosomal protein S20
MAVVSNDHMGMERYNASERQWSGCIDAIADAGIFQNNPFFYSFHHLSGDSCNHNPIIPEFANLRVFCYSFATMPITRNAKKALRVSDRKRAINDRTKKTLKEGVKGIQKLVTLKKWDEAKKSLSAAYSAIDKAAKKGVIKKNTASRKKSRLSRMAKAA